MESTVPSSSSGRAIIVGGGIAGISCALRLAERGVRVMLLETRKKLGGRATSFQDVRTGLWIDNCQHVALGCCTNYLDLCRRLGVESHISWLEEIHWVEAGGRVSTLRRSALPAPAHYALSFLGARFLSPIEKARAAWGMKAALLTDRSLWRDRVFSVWLSSHGQTPALVRTFWEPIVISACNLTPDRVCAATALHVFQEGFLAHRDAAIVGVSSVPLVDLYDAAEQTIEHAGGSVRFGASVESVWRDRVRLASGEEMTADAVVCAVTAERALKVIAADAQEGDERFAGIARITHSPILGVHLTFDRPVLPLHSAVLVNRATQWLFRKSPPGEVPAMLGSHVHAVISGADAWMGLDEAEITRRVLDDMHACFPESRGARVLSSRPVKEKFATFAPTPEVESSRPTTTSASGQGVILAGDYVQTGWPATMEGATRSGYLAASAVLGARHDSMVLPPLKPGGLVRLAAPRLTRGL